MYIVQTLLTDNGSINLTYRLGHPEATALYPCHHNLVQLRPTKTPPEHNLA